MKTRVTKLLGVEKPIIQGGMAWVAESHLAAAVSNAGGFGIIGAANAPAEVVRNYIREAKEMTDKPFGVKWQGRQRNIWESSSTGRIFDVICKWKGGVGI